MAFKNKYTAYNYHSGGYMWYYNYDFSYYNNLTTRYSIDNNRLERKKYQKDFQEKASKEFKPIIVDANAASTHIFKNNRMFVSIKPDDYKNFKWKEDILIDAFDKIPKNSKWYYGMSLCSYFNDNYDKLMEFYGKRGVSDSEIKLAIKQFFIDKTITQSQFESLFTENPIEDKKIFEEYKKSAGWYLWSGIVWDKNYIGNLYAYNKFLSALRKKVHTKSITTYEDSIRQWKRINPRYIKKTSWKPLVTKSIEEQKKKKVFIIMDCSGSMWYADVKRDASHLAASFSKALYDSGIFNCEHIIAHSDRWWDNMCKHFKKNEFFNYEWWCEGFNAIHDNLKKEWLSDVDYIIVLTDLLIDKINQKGLYQYLSQGKKHIILSFKKKWDIQWLNVRTVEKTSDIINSVTTILNQ